MQTDESIARLDEEIDCKPREEHSQKIADINDANRIIMQQTNYFRTVFVRYRAKDDMQLAKELSELNINLGDSGIEIVANYRNI